MRKKGISVLSANSIRFLHASLHFMMIICIRCRKIYAHPYLSLCTDHVVLHRLIPLCLPSIDLLSISPCFRYRLLVQLSFSLSLLDLYELNYSARTAIFLEHIIARDYVNFCLMESKFILLWIFYLDGWISRKQHNRGKTRE